MDAGAELAWFGFEGSFNYEHLLTPDIARQIYAVVDSIGAATSLEDGSRDLPEWHERVGRARAQLPHRGRA
jgi:hypothetical protein